MKSCFVSVIMPALNSAATIGAQLEALGRQSFEGRWEIIVADNGSKDGTRNMIESWTDRLPNLRLVDASSQRGANAARNIGARESRGDLLLFCDADDVADSNWVTSMACALASHDMVGGGLERSRLNDEVALAARPLKTSDGLLDSFGFLPYTPFANAGMRKEIWRDSGFFDESYRYGSTDVEFFWRAQLRGATLGFAQDAIIHYRLRSDLSGIAHQAYSYGRSHPKLFAAFGSAGMPRSNLSSACMEWGWIVSRSPWLFGRKVHRAAWLYRASMRYGRVVGSVRNGVLYL